MTELAQLTQLCERLGAPPAQAQAMAAQLLKRADQLALERSRPREEMMAHRNLAKPELTKARQDFAFAGNSIGQDIVKRADAVGSNKEQPIAKIVDIPNFSTPNGYALQKTLQQNCRHAAPTIAIPNQNIITQPESTVA